MSDLVPTTARVHELVGAGSAEGGRQVQSQEALLLVEVGDVRCALRLADVLEVHHMVQVSPLPQAPNAVEGAIDLRGSVVAVLDLRRRLGLPSRPPVPDDRLVIVPCGDGTLALRVDAVVDIHHIPASDLVPAPAAIADAATGIARTPDGLVLIQDVERFLTGDEGAVLDAALDAFRA